MTPETRRILELSNPWLLAPECFEERARARLPTRFIHRLGAEEIAHAMKDDRKAHLVTGPRQAGKSTLVWSLLRAARRPPLFLNCEEPTIRAWCRSPTRFASEVQDWLAPGGVIFLEEAQHLEEPGLFLKGLVDARVGRSAIVTGSASFHLMARTRESLAGRATRHHVWPLRLAEVRDDSLGLPAARYADARCALDRMLVVGGYPEVWTSDEPRAVLDELVGAFVLRDASDRFAITRPDAFRTLLRLIAGQVGDLVNRAELAQVLGIAASTVDDYLGILEETHLLRRIRPFIGGKRAELTKTPKPYFIDNGLRNALAGSFAPLEERADQGKLLESWVFSELHKAFPDPGGVRFWRTRSGAEVDFIVEPSPGQIVPVEVKASRGRLPISRSARSFIQAYTPERFLFVYRGEARHETLGSTRIEWLPAEDLPEVLGSLTTDD